MSFLYADRHKTLSPFVMKKRLFSCSQELLYAVALLAWLLCRRSLSAFAAFKALYTDRFVDDKVAKVEAAKAIDDQRQRNLVVQEQRELFDDSLKLNLGHMQSLKRFIRSAYKPKDRAAKRKAAGFDLYKVASTGNLSTVRTMLETALKFIDVNAVVLQANDNMPASFVITFKADAADCDKLSRKIPDVEITKNKETVDKNEADNEIYDELMTMLEDGQQVFKGTSAARQWVFSALLKLAKGSHPAKLKGHVYDSVTGKGLVNVRISTTTGDYSTTSKKYGRYIIERILGGVTYTVLVEAEGYQPLLQEVTIKPGTAKTVKFILVAIEAEASKKAA